MLAGILKIFFSELTKLEGASLKKVTINVSHILFQISHTFTEGKNQRSGNVDSLLLIFVPPLNGRKNPEHPDLLK